jgi:hypothetical protein
MTPLHRRTHSRLPALARVLAAHLHGLGGMDNTGAMDETRYKTPLQPLHAFVRYLSCYIATPGHGTRFNAYRFAAAQRNGATLVL